MPPRKQVLRRFIEKPGCEVVQMTSPRVPHAMTTCWMRLLMSSSSEVFYESIKRASSDSRWGLRTICWANAVTLQNKAVRTSFNRAQLAAYQTGKSYYYRAYLLPESLVNHQLSTRPYISHNVCYI